eukprot:m.161214 g.161214  ORF g.161214 m.161214 type:complete len:246 (+) comp17637_c0_seq9:539-1276(+)
MGLREYARFWLTASCATSATCLASLTTSCATALQFCDDNCGNLLGALFSVNKLEAGRVELVLQQIGFCTDAVTANLTVNGDGKVVCDVTNQQGNEAVLVASVGSAVAPVAAKSTYPVCARCYETGKLYCPLTNSCVQQDEDCDCTDAGAPWTGNATSCGCMLHSEDGCAASSAGCQWCVGKALCTHAYRATETCMACASHGSKRFGVAKIAAISVGSLVALVVAVSFVVYMVRVLRNSCSDYSEL